MGQIVRLSNKIVESKDEYILAQIEKNPLWKGYVAGQLTEVNQKNQVNLGGRDPRDRFLDDEDDYQLHVKVFYEANLTFFRINLIDMEEFQERMIKHLEEIIKMIMMMTTMMMKMTKKNKREICEF